MQMLIQNMPKPPRPKVDDSKVFESVATELAEDIMQPGDKDGDDVRRCLAKALDDCCGNYDGYKLASYLDSRWGWEADAQLVDTLDGAWHMVREAKDAIIKTWVDTYQIQPLHVVGDAVEVTHQGTRHSGTIREIYPKTAQYAVNIPALGHVPPSSNACGTTGTYFDYEAVDGTARTVEA